MNRRVLPRIFFAFPALFLPSTLIGPEAALARSETPREIPFEYVNGHLIEVRGSIGSQADLRFLIDLGTPRTMIDAALAGKTADATQPTELILKEFSLGAIPMPECRVYLTDLTSMPAIPNDVAGIVGLDILQKQNLAIDFTSKKIVFFARTEGEHQVRFVMNEAGLTVDSHWKGVLMKLVLSTGVEAIALDRERVDQIPIKLPTLTKGSLRFRGEASQEATDLFELRDSTLSDTKLAGLGVLRKIDWPKGAEQLMGFLPLTALHARRVSLDFEKNLLFWDSSDSKTEQAGLQNNQARASRKH